MTQNSKLRQQITWQAARLMYSRQESEYYRAKMKAARKVCRSRVKPSDLPSNREIRDEIQSLARLFEGTSRDQHLIEMRIESLRVMKILMMFRPRLIGSTLTGHVRRGSDIDIHVFSDSVEAVTGCLDHEAMIFDVEHKRVRKHQQERIFTHIHITDRFPIELTMYAANMAHYVFKSSITSKGIQRASIAELEQLLEKEYPQLDLEQELCNAENKVDPYQIYEMLLLPLESVKQNKKHHPEGDVLYHSLQVFDLAYSESPYDEEFLLAALLHDVGKGIDPKDHVAAGLEALEGSITTRTAWLIAHHMQANQLRDGTLGARARRRLQEHDDFDTLMLLSECDRGGRVVGVEVTDIPDALRMIKDLAEWCQ